MSWIAQNLWLIPILPLLAAGVTALTKQPHRRFASALAIGLMVGALVLSCVAFASTLGRLATAANFREVFNFTTRLGAGPAGGSHAGHG